jgi:hypothetical protein
VNPIEEGSDEQGVHQVHQQLVKESLRGAALTEFFALKELHRDAVNEKGDLAETEPNQLEGGEQRPDGIHAGVDVTGAAGFNYMTYSPKWSNLSAPEKERYKIQPPIQRTTGDAPTNGLGYWVEEKSYSAAGTAITRRNFRPF